MKRPLFAFVAAAAVFLTGRASAYQILMDYNTFKVRDGIERTGLLKCDGVWCILQNSDLDNGQWKQVFDLTGTGTIIAEDNPAQRNRGQAPNNNYERTKLIASRIDGTLCYNETGAQPGGTLLTNEQIDADAANHGGNVIALTRYYSTNPDERWRRETDRNLANPKVIGMAMETVLDYKNLACDELMSVTLKKHNKPVYFLLPSSNEAYVRQCLEFLKSRQPELMRDPRVFIVLCPYQTPGTPWFGEVTTTAQGMLEFVKRLNN